MKNLIKKSAINLLLTAFILGGAFLTSVNAGNNEPVAANSLLYIGNIENKPVFELNVKTENKKQFTVVILDTDNSILYKENYNATSLKKKFMLNIDEFEGKDVRFEVIDNETKKVIRYSVNYETKTVRDVVINKS